jgi:5-(carboxyamino)imidazole ribonucleotide mutase
MKAIMKPQVSIILGSDSDLPVMQEATTILEAFDIPYDISIISAHRNPEGLRQKIKESSAKVFIGAAGGAAHLPGVIAAQTVCPVIGVPIRAKQLEGLDSLLSIAQMPSGIPVATVAINGAKNAGLLAIQIIATADKQLQTKLFAFKENMKETVEKKSEKLQKIGVAEYLKQA